MTDNELRNLINKKLAEIGAIAEAGSVSTDDNDDYLDIISIVHEASLLAQCDPGKVVPFDQSLATQ